MKSLLVFFFIVAIQAIDPPPELLVCKYGDTECVAKAIKSALIMLKNGRKDLGITQTDPLVIENIHIAGSGGKVDLEQTYTTMAVAGISDSIISKGSLNMENGNCEIKMNILSPRLEITGQYIFTGKLLLFQINGVGACNVTLMNVRSNHIVPCEKKEINGVEHIKITGYELDMQPEKIYYNFENMVKDNPQISNEVVKVMNENDLEIFAEIKKDYDNTFAEIFKHITNQVFKSIPINKLVLR